MKNRFQRTVSIFLTLCMILGTMAGLTIGLAPTVHAVPATAITLTNSDSTPTVLSEAVEEDTYAWDPETSTLTLNGWTGQRINGGGDYNLHLKGTNTIQMAIAAVDMLLDRIKNPGSEHAKLILPPSLIVRKSCRALGK